MSDSEFRNLECLINFTNPYVDGFKQTLNSYYPHLWKQLEIVPTLKPQVSSAVLAELLCLACQCQNMMNIELGRAGLMALPREWLLQNIEEAAKPLLELDDDWEYLRLLEVCWLLEAGDLERRILLGGLNSSNPDVSALCKEYLDDNT